MKRSIKITNIVILNIISIFLVTCLKIWKYFWIVMYIFEKMCVCQWSWTTDQITQLGHTTAWKRIWGTIQCDKFVLLVFVKIIFCEMHDIYYCDVKKNVFRKVIFFITLAVFPVSVNVFVGKDEGEKKLVPVKRYKQSCTYCIFSLWWVKLCCGNFWIHWRKNIIIFINLKVFWNYFII